MHVVGIFPIPLLLEGLWLICSVLVSVLLIGCDFSQSHFSPMLLMFLWNAKKRIIKMNASLFNLIFQMGANDDNQTIK